MSVEDHEERDLRQVGECEEQAQHEDAGCDERDQAPPEERVVVVVREEVVDPSAIVISTVFNAGLG